MEFANYNKDDNRRQEILGIDVDWMERRGGTASIDNVTVEQLKLLIDEKFADPEECQNDAPSIQDIYDFMENYPEFVAHGYIVSPNRTDYRVSLEGVKLERKPTPDELQDFTTLFRHADTFDIVDGCYCWFD